MQALFLWSQNYATELLHCCAVGRLLPKTQKWGSRQTTAEDTEMGCPRTGYDRDDIHTHFVTGQNQKERGKNGQLVS